VILILRRLWARLEVVIFFFHGIRTTLEKGANRVDRQLDGRELDRKRRKVIRNGFNRGVVDTFVLDHRLKNSLIREARFRTSAASSLRRTE
jgi:hypothetical protein